MTTDWEYMETMTSTFLAVSHLLVERVEQLDADKVHVTGTAHEDDQRELGVHQQQ